MKTFTKTLKYLFIVGAAVALTAGGCSNLGGDGAGSCKESSYCTDYIGADYTQESVRNSCLGTYSEDACASGSDGTCLVNSGQPNETKITYFGAGGEANCLGAGGIFTN